MKTDAADMTDVTEKIKKYFKIVGIFLYSFCIFFLLFSFLLSNDLDERFTREMIINEILQKQKIGMIKQIEYMKGKIDNLDPVFDWWFSVMYGRMAEKNRRAFSCMNYLLRNF